MSSSDEDPGGFTPEQIYNFFKTMPKDDLEELARDAVAALRAADNRKEAEEAVVHMAPWFLDVTWPRLNTVWQDRIKTTLDEAEERFGSLAAVLGLDEALLAQEAVVKKNPKRKPTSRERIERLEKTVAELRAELERMKPAQPAPRTRRWR